MNTTIEMQTPESAFRTHTMTVRPIWKDAALEFFGTFLFVYISLAGVNQTVLSGSSDQVHIALCFAIGLTSGILVAKRSGAHLNPAVTMTVYCTSQSFELVRMISYIIAQLCGGFCAGLLVLAIYYSWINNYPQSNVLIGSFGTLKNENNSLGSAIIDQFVGSALLMIPIAIAPESWVKPITIGVTIGALGLFQGSNGFAFNLARDFAPRLASTIVFGADSFSAASNWFWVPVVVPFFGIPVGWFLARQLTMIQ
jgi:MIP family channel proteins